MSREARKPTSKVSDERGAAILLAVETQSPGLLLFGAVFAWAYPTVSLSRKVKRWHEDILLEIPTLVRMLKFRFAISDTVTNAVVNVRDSLSGPLGEEWLLMVSEVETRSLWIRLWTT